MGNIIHMQPVEVREVARQIDLMVKDMISYGFGIRDNYGTLSRAWQGPHADGFLKRMRTWIQEYDKQIEKTQTMGFFLSGEVDKWQCKDNTKHGMYLGPVMTISKPGQEPPIFIPDEDYDWLTFIDGILDTPGIDHLIIPGLLFGLFMDLQKGEPWYQAFISEFVETGVDLGLELIFPPYTIYSFILVWLHAQSAITEVTGIVTPEARAIMDIAKLIDKRIGYMDDAVWLQNFAEMVDIKEEFGEAVYGLLAYMATHIKFKGVFYLDDPRLAPSPRIVTPISL